MGEDHLQSVKAPEKELDKFPFPLRTNLKEYAIERNAQQ